MALLIECGRRLTILLNSYFFIIRFHVCILLADLEFQDLKIIKGNKDFVFFFLLLGSARTHKSTSSYDSIKGPVFFLFARRMSAQVISSRDTTMCIQHST